jgi:hypothetical protein
MMHADGTAYCTGRSTGKFCLEYTIFVRSLGAIDRAIGTGALETCRLIRKSKDHWAKSKKAEGKF